MAKVKLVIILKRTCLLFFSTLLILLLAVAGALYVILCGPSVSAQELLVRSLKETSALGFVPDLFLPEDRIREILKGKEVVVETEDTDTSLVRLTATRQEQFGQGTETPGEDGSSEDGITLVEITGASYRGILMIVDDPDRIFMGTPDTYGGNGLTLAKMIEKYDAIGGINAGGFYDPSGTGTGGQPDGIVIKEGELVWGDTGTMSTVIGFDKEGILHVGYMSAQSALDAGIQQACSFGPALIVNGKALSNSTITSSGVNPRTAIGQRADGAVLLLVIDGRHVTSLGATHEDTISIMLEHGAVNAANLDGGSSSEIIYQGETLNLNFRVYPHSRRLPTAFLVKK